MSTKFYKRDEQIKLIMECRQSGLSNYQWCNQKGIKPGTFYNWVSKLRKSGYTFPDTGVNNTQTAVAQEIVKVNLLKSENTIPILEQNACQLSSIHTSGIAAELMLGNISLIR